jgi:hypothetical protein
MPFRIFKRWTASLPYSLPVAWILLQFVTLRWQQDTPPGDGELAPLWGFPLPWTWWPPVSSLEWEISIPALLVNLSTYSVIVAIVGEFLRPRLPTISKWPRRACYAGLAVLCGLAGFFWLFGVAIGAHRLVLLLPTDHVTRISICFVQGCYQTH